MLADQKQINLFFLCHLKSDPVINNNCIRTHTLEIITSYISIQFRNELSLTSFRRKSKIENIKKNYGIY